MTRRIVSTFLLVFVASLLVKSQPQSNQATTPDFYELAGNHLKITYTTTSLGGGPRFTYNDGSRTLSFKGNEIRETNSDVGTLVSVTIHMTVDTGSTTFTLLVPSVKLKGSSPAQIHTMGITTVHKFSVVPAFNLGQTELYTTTQLSGTAKSVAF
jgi:hypothetical protein